MTVIATPTAATVEATAVMAAGSQTKGGEKDNAHADNNEAGNVDNADRRAKHGGDSGSSDKDPSESDSSARAMNLSMQTPMLESVKGLLIIVRGARLETMADLTGCRKIVAKGARGDSDRALVAYVPHMLVAREITALVRELVRAFKRQDDRGMKAVLDAYIPVWEHKSPPPDKGREDGSWGRPPKVLKR